MRVVQVIDSLHPSGGAEQSLVAIAPALLDRSIALSVIKLSDDEGIEKALTDVGVPVLTAVGAGRMQKFLSLRSLLTDQRPDLVHTTLFEADVIGRLAASSARIPVLSSLVNTSYGPEHRSSPHLRWWKVRAAQFTDLSTARFVRHFHAITAHVADTMSARLHIDRSRVTVIPRGRSARTLGRRTAERRRVARQRERIGEVPVVLAAARGEHQKGLDALIRSIPTIRSQHSDVVVLIAGRDGQATEELKRLAEALGVAPSVRFLGFRSDVPDLMVAADVLAFPSRWEGLGGTLIEAMALELPIVATAIPAIEEVAGGVAALVRAEDPDALGAEILAVLADEARRTAMSTAGRTRFGDCYEIGSIADQTVDLYRRVAQGRQGTSG